jgi:hypothetical protein
VIECVMRERVTMCVLQCVCLSPHQLQSLLVGKLAGVRRWQQVVIVGCLSSAT